MSVFRAPKQNHFGVNIDLHDRKKQYRTNVPLAVKMSTCMTLYGFPPMEGLHTEGAESLDGGIRTLAEFGTLMLKL